MQKLTLLVRRKPGMSRAAFKDYYESTHAPLASSLMARCTKYVRNFVTEEVSGPVDFDVITEFWFDVEGAWEDAQKALTDEAVRLRLEEDEAQFMDRGTMQFFLVDERSSDPGALLGNR